MTLTLFTFSLLLVSVFWMHVFVVLFCLCWHSCLFYVWLNVFLLLFVGFLLLFASCPVNISFSCLFIVMSITRFYIGSLNKCLEQSGKLFNEEMLGSPPPTFLWRCPNRIQYQTRLSAHKLEPFHSKSFHVVEQSWPQIIWCRGECSRFPCCVFHICKVDICHETQLTNTNSKIRKIRVSWVGQSTRVNDNTKMLKRSCEEKTYERQIPDWSFDKRSF